MNLHDAAMSYAEGGWRIFPCRPGRKEPSTAHGHKDATSHLEVTHQRWTDSPDANIGFSLPEGILVVDIDPRNGAPAGFAGGLPATKAAATPSGGTHLYYQVPEGVDWLTAWPEVPGVDIKRPGKGYVLLPPSRLEGRSQYEWLGSLAMAALPREVVGLLTRPARRLGGDAVSPRRRFFPWETGSAYGLSVLRSSLERLHRSREGRRNNDLFVATRYVAEHIAGGELDEDAALPQLRDAALATGLDLSEVMNTMSAAYDVGIDNPRSAP